MRKLKVLLLCGGRSAEHQVSLVSAATIARALSPAKFQIETVYIDSNGRWLTASRKLLENRGRVNGKAPALAASRSLSPLAAATSSGAKGFKPDVVFPVLHGPMGEDGTIQGLLESAGVPYVGAGVLGSALGMDKDVAKRLVRAAGLPVLPYVVARPGFPIPSDVGALGFPLFVKPAGLGSSVGVSKVERKAELGKALREAFRFDTKALVEKAVEAREIECAVLGDPWSRPGDPLELRASGLGEVVARARFYTYAAKYLDPDGAERFIPAPLPYAKTAGIREMAVRAFRALEGYGMGRVDFLLDKRTGKVYFNEVNTIPGFTASSMYPELWKAAGVPTPRLVELLIDLAIRRSGRRRRLRVKP